MLFSASVLFGLFATTFALPAPELVARAQIPASVNCDGAVFDVSSPSISNIPPLQIPSPHSYLNPLTAH
jgi:hypothetical protein